MAWRRGYIGLMGKVPRSHVTAVSPYCPLFQDAVELVGRRWTGAVIRSLLAGSNRFSDILSKVPGLSDRLLAERLRELESAGLVVRTVFPETPVRIEYSLTEKGEELRGIVVALGNWAGRWAESPRSG